MILFVDKNSGILFLKTKLGYVPVFIPLEHTLAEIYETTPGPLISELSLSLLKQGNFYIDIKDDTPVVTYISGESIPSKVIIKLLPTGSLIGEGIELPGVWGFDFNAKPVMMYSRSSFEIEMIGDIDMLKPGVTFESDYTPRIIETE